MTRPKIADMSVDQLIAVFAEISMAQGAAIETCQTAKANRLILRRFVVRDELNARPGDALTALQELFAHPHAWVRYNAANALLYEIPNVARPVIQAIVDLQDFPVSGDAGMTLSFFDGELRGLGVRRLKE